MRLKYAFIKKHSTDYPVRCLCQTLKVHPSGYYAWLAEPQSARAKEDHRLLGLIKHAWLESGGVYGYLYQLADTTRPPPLNIAGKKRLRILKGIRERVIPSAPLAAGTGLPVPCVSYEAFQTYVNCPLQYHYRHELTLTAEQEIDVSIRARWAVTDMLYEFVKNGAVAQSAFQSAWKTRLLPPKADDPQLYQDAVIAAKRGLALVKSIRGDLVEGFVAEVGGLQIELPWMLSAGSELHWLRAHEGQSGTMKQLKPMMVSLNHPGIRSATIHSLITDRSITDGASRGLDWTTVYKMAARFVAGDRSHNRGKGCSRCAYLSVCDKTP